MLRIVTRPDFDGVVCAVLLADALAIREPVYWVEPNEFIKGRADIRSGDIVANLPLDPRCDLWFDHHSTNRTDRPFEGLFRIAPSAARIVFEYFHTRFKRDYRELVDWADRIDSAHFTSDEVLHPERYDYVLLSMTISSENGPDEDYWNKLVKLLAASGIQQVMADPDVAARCRRVMRENNEYADWLRQCTRIEGQVAITDFRHLEHPPAGNRFLAYCLFPQTVVSVRIRYEGRKRETVVVNIGHSIFNPHCNVHVGKLLAGFEGGGHRGAASARFDVKKMNDYLPEIISRLVRNEG